MGRVTNLIIGKDLVRCSLALGEARLAGLTSRQLDKLVMSLLFRVQIGVVLLGQFLSVSWSLIPIAHPIRLLDISFACAPVH